MSWFLIAKDNADAERWGCPAGFLFLVVGSDGSTVKIAKKKAKLPADSLIAVFNIEAYPKRTTGTPAEERSVILNNIREAFPATAVEGLFVHFGGYDPEAPHGCREQVRRDWQDPQKYPGLAELFKGLDVFPYSAQVGETWSADLRKLAEQIKGSCGMGPVSVAAKLPDWQSLLEGAKRSAYGRYGDQADIAKKTDAELAGRALMPVFIYLDGLLYAHEINDETERKQKVKGMEDVIRADMKDVLDGISPTLRQSSPRAIQEIIAQLDSGEDGLRAIAEIFCSEYRDFLKVAMPESAAKNELTRETKA